VYCPQHCSSKVHP